MQVLGGVTSSNELAVIQAKQGDLWEPSTEAELDHMEAEGIQQPVIQPHVVALDPPLAAGATVRYLHCIPTYLCHVLSMVMPAGRYCSLQLCIGGMNSKVCVCVRVCIL